MFLHIVPSSVLSCSLSLSFLFSDVEDPKGALRREIVSNVGEKKDQFYKAAWQNELVSHVFCAMP